MKQFYVYILSNKNNGTLYVGVTSDLVRRIYEHKNKLLEGFSKKYDLTNLVYYEVYESPEDAISREKKLKKEYRKNKLKLINEFNPKWDDLSQQFL